MKKVHVNQLDDLRVDVLKSKSNVKWDDSTKYPEIDAIEKMKQEMCQKTKYLEIAKVIYLLDNTSLHEHGFDLSNPMIIEEEINKGRIKPFPRAHVVNKAEE